MPLVFAVSFVVLGNTATSAVDFASAVLQASGATQTPSKILAIAFSACTFALLLHILAGRTRHNIRLSNILGVIKLLMLVMMVFVGFAWFNKSAVPATNFDTTTSFSETNPMPWRINRYATVLVYAVFPFGGFQQGNYVRGSGPDTSGWRC